MTIGCPCVSIGAASSHPRSVRKTKVAARSWRQLLRRTWILRKSVTKGGQGALFGSHDALRSSHTSSGSDRLKIGILATFRAREGWKFSEHT